MKNPRRFLSLLRAFTLIELLVVIAIIAILAGLLLPAVNGALDSARKTSAKNDVVQIATAVIAYQTEYGMLPVASATDVNGALLTALTASAVSTNNPRQIVFLEAPTFKNNKGGVNSAGAYLDPWSNSYKIKMDDNYDNTIEITSGNPTAENSVTESIRKSVGVYNIDSSVKDKSKPKYYRHVVRSWD